jgi:sulfate adenylyltransferase subunit 2
MDHLNRLEAQSIFILREAYKKFGKLGMLWSIGKDSTVMFWLVKKGVFWTLSFPIYTCRHFLQDT